MRFLTEIELKKLSFPDCIVKDMKYDSNNKIVYMLLSCGFLDINQGIKLKACHITIKDWEFMEINCYITKTKQWEKLNDKNFNYLADICEFEYRDNIIIRGFTANSGQWLEIVFKKGILEVQSEL